MTDAELGESPRNAVEPRSGATSRRLILGSLISANALLMCLIIIAAVVVATRQPHLAMLSKYKLLQAIGEQQVMYDLENEFLVEAPAWTPEQRGEFLVRVYTEGIHMDGETAWIYFVGFVGRYGEEMKAAAERMKDSDQYARKARAIDQLLTTSLTPDDIERARRELTMQGFP